ncbi:MAG: hypothetical protein WCF26_11805 [Candidatus Sulfotelmatobacter sp.]
MKRKRIHCILVLCCVIGAGALSRPAQMRAQSAAPQESAPAKSAERAEPPAKSDGPQAYSGMYSFLKEGEFVQLTVEDAGHVTGFISRFGDQESDKGAFLDQFFKTGKLEGNELSFTTEVVHGTGFDFKGTVERGDGKKPGDEAYFVLKGTLTQNDSDVNKKVTAHSQEVVLKIFPEDAGPKPVVRK